MFRKIFISILASFLLVYSGNKAVAQQPTDTTANNYDKILTQREQQAANKKTDGLGTLIATINFEIKTNDTSEYKDGFQLLAHHKLPARSIAVDVVRINGEYDGGICFPFNALMASGSGFPFGNIASSAKDII